MFSHTTPVWCGCGRARGSRDSSGQFGRVSCGSVRPLAAQELHANSNTGAEANASALAVYSPGYTYGLTCIAGGTAKANEARGQVRAMLDLALDLARPRACAQRGCRPGRAGPPAQAKALRPCSTRISPRAAAGRRLQPCGCGSCYSPAAAAAAACAPSLGAPRMRPVVRVRVRARARARARGRGSDLWSRFGSGSGSGLGLGFGFGFGTGFGFGLATYGLRGLRAAVHRLVAGYHPLSPLLACVRGSDRYTGEGRPRGAISGGPCPLVIIPYARSQHERRGPGGALGSAGRICGGRPHRCGRGGAALFQPAHLELPQLRVWAPVPPHHARAWLGVGVG